MVCRISSIKQYFRGFWRHMGRRKGSSQVLVTFWWYISAFAWCWHRKQCMTHVQNLQACSQISKSITIQLHNHNTTTHATDVFFLLFSSIWYLTFISIGICFSWSAWHHSHLGPWDCPSHLIWTNWKGHYPKMARDFENFPGFWAQQRTIGGGFQYV